MKNKIYFLSLAFWLALSHCVALNMAGVSDSYKGTEAKKKIKDAAFGADIWAYGLIYGEKNATGLAVVDGAFVDIYSKINDAKYYPKSDVDKCADDVYNFGILLIADGSTTTLISKNCTGLKANGLVY